MMAGVGELDEEQIREAVEKSDTYMDAAATLQLPYGRVRTLAMKRGWKPKNIARREERRRPAHPRAFTPPLEPKPRAPAPEAKPPRLSAWIPLPDSIAAKSTVLRVRIDQDGRVRGEVTALSEGWCGWAVRDVKGDVVGKPGFLGSLVEGRAELDAEEAVDEVLVELGWLPPDHKAPRNPCTMAAYACSPPGPPRDPLVLLAEKLLTSKRADRLDLGVELAKGIVERARQSGDTSAMLIIGSVPQPATRG